MPRYSVRLSSRLADFTDIAEQMRRHVGRRVEPRGHVLVDDARQLPLARLVGNDLRFGGILDEDDRPIARLAAAAVDRLAQLVDIGARRLRERLQRLVDVPGLLADQRDVVGHPVLDEHRLVPIEQHAARRRQRQPPQMVVVGHLQEPLVLRDLEEPERDAQQRENQGHRILNRRQPQRQVSAIVGHHGGCRHG